MSKHRQVGPYVVCINCGRPCHNRTLAFCPNHDEPETSATEDFTVCDWIMLAIMGVSLIIVVLSMLHVI